MEELVQNMKPEEPASQSCMSSKSILQKLGNYDTLGRSPLSTRCNMLALKGMPGPFRQTQVMREGKSNFQKEEQEKQQIPERTQWALSPLHPY